MHITYFSSIITNKLIYYILFTILLFIIIFFAHIKLKYKFWTLQPVFHFYDFYYYIKNIGIINFELPKKNKYTNFNNLYFYNSNILTENQWKNIVAFIQINYLQNKNKIKGIYNVYYPTLNNINNYFKGHNHNSYWSLYYIDNYLNDTKNNNIIKSKELIGCMSSRPLTCCIIDKNNEIIFDLYYVDYLCVSKNHRKSGIAQQIIQTHEYNQSHSNKKICVSLFKREEELNFIVPVTCYDTYCYELSKFIYIDDVNLDTNIKMLTCDKQNIYYFYHFIKETKYKWNIFIIPSISNLYSLIESKNIFIKMFVVSGEKEIISAFVFKKTCTYLEKNKEVLSCIASINGDYLSKQEFIDCFKLSVYSLLNENFYYLSIENLSDNKTINDHFDDAVLFKSKTAYFFYNFAHSPFKSEKCLIIN